MKKSIALLLTAILMLTMPVGVFAAKPVDTEEPVLVVDDLQDTLTFDTLSPSVLLPITWTLYLEKDVKNAIEVALYIENVKVDQTTMDADDTQMIQDKDSDFYHFFTASGTLDWEIDEPGTFDVKVEAVIDDTTTLTNEQTIEIKEKISQDENDSDDPDPTDTEEFPAAPAVAAALLKAAGVDHRYETDKIAKNGKAIMGNYITDVAKMMGTHEDDQDGSWFMGIDKSDVDDYREAVEDFLDSLGAFED